MKRYEKNRNENISVIDEELLVNCYHKIILELELPKVIEGDLHATTESVASIKNFEYKLNKVEIFNKLKELGLNTKNIERVFEELRNRGFLVELPETPDQKNVDVFRTLHMDILIRSAEIRTKWGSIRYIVTPRVSLYRIKSPSKRDRAILPFEQGIKINRKVYNSIKNFFNNEKTSKDFISILREYLGSGLDGYQAFVLSSILESKSKAFILTAPTGSGKTEIFLFYILARLMKNKHEGQSKERAILVYPRKFLSIDQAGRIIRLLFITNKYGYNLTFGLRDSATPRKNDTNVKDGDYFRGLKCPNCNKAQLVYDIGDGSVRCSLCKKDFPFIKSTRPAIGKDPPDVIVTNMWALEVRMMD
ncbi:MAG: DEAD/DEAH box helicase, partial [Ignisphaera sp.]